MPRAHKTSILEFLREQWAIDRRAEWSIWMIYSNVEMPHQYISSDVDKSFYLSTHGRARILKKLTEDVIEPELYTSVMAIFLLHHGLHMSLT